MWRAYEVARQAKVIAAWPEDPSSVPRSQEGTDSLKLPSDFHISAVAWVCTAPLTRTHARTQ